MKKMKINFFFLLSKKNLRSNLKKAKLHFKSSVCFLFLCILIHLTTKPWLPEHNSKTPTKSVSSLS